MQRFLGNMSASVKSARTIELRITPLEARPDNLFVYRGCPDRTFKTRANVLLWPNESWLNLQYLKFFLDCDREDIEVVVHTTRNFLPIASLIGHQVVMQETSGMSSSVFNPRSNSSYGFDIKFQEQALGLKRWDFGLHHQRDSGRLPVSDRELEVIAHYFVRKPLVVEVEAFEWFMGHRSIFPNNAVMIELKCAWSKRLLARLASLDDCALLGADKVFQQQLLKTYNCGAFFLSVQLLAGLYCNWSYIALHGAASVFSLLFPTNLLFSLDPQNVPHSMHAVRSAINRQHHGICTYTAANLAAGFADTLATDDRLFEKTIMLALRNREGATSPDIIANIGS